MKAIMLMFDTLTRKYLSSYGNDWCLTPNFKRLEEKCCVMDKFYAGSMPCMPARRELHTGKYNFLHRSWGPLEPFDFSCFQKLTENGVYTHLCTDHSHYWEDGGATYHNRYSSWQGFRGQEGDRWMPRLGTEVPELPPYHKVTISVQQHLSNQKAQLTEEEMSGSRTYKAGMEFIDKYHDFDNWFLQVECFDPHEPYYVPDKYRKLYQLADNVLLNWPAYTEIVDENIDLLALRREYAALITMCDYHLGLVLDQMDKYNMWEDTMLIVNTDHGFLLGEHDYLGKTIWPMYQEMIHTPCFIHVPGVEPRRVEHLAATIDIAPTLLDFFGLEIPENMEGRSLLKAVRDDEKIHDYVLFGAHGGHTCITDGDYVFMKSSATKENKPFVECTLMPTYQRVFFTREQLEIAKLMPGDKFSNGYPYLKVGGTPAANQSHRWGDLLFDVRDGDDEISDEAIESRLKENLVRILKEIDAPSEEFERMGL